FSPSFFIFFTLLLYIAFWTTYGNMELKINSLFWIHTPRIPCFRQTCPPGPTELPIQIKGLPSCNG
ncbi:hypothetical protein KI387_010408, partial [Taxus chinensis]